MAIERDQYLNVTEVAEQLGVSRVSVWRWIRDGRLSAVRLGHRTTRIRQDDLERLIASQSRLVTAPKFAQSSKRVDIESPPFRGANGHHRVQFYERDDALIASLSDFVTQALQMGGSSIVVATPAHRNALEKRVRRAGIDLGTARDAGRYMSLDAEEVLARFMIGGMPDPTRFNQVVGTIIERATASAKPVHVFGEMVALLAKSKQFEATVRLEEMWNDLQQRLEFDLYCAYPVDRLTEETLDSICAAHSQVIPGESYISLTDEDQRLRDVAILQHKARWLESEIAERRVIEQKLRESLASEQHARSELECALRIRDEFLAIAAHELKTPIGGLSVQAQLLLRKYQRNGHLEPERLVPALESINGQAKKLASFVDRLLDVSRFDAGKFGLELSTVDLAELVRRVSTERAGLSTRHIVVCDVPHSLIAQVDPMRFEQVLVNLIDNATKYDPTGGEIAVTLSLPEAGVAELSVKDHGPGIPEAQLERVFDRFYQAQGNEHVHGMGLGLHLSRQLVELHGGTIHIEFPPDCGTRVVIRLPIQPVPHQ